MKTTNTRPGIVLRMSGAAGGDPSGITGLVAIATGSRTVRIVVAIGHIRTALSVIVLALARHLRSMWRLEWGRLYTDARERAIRCDNAPHNPDLEGGRRNG